MLFSTHEEREELGNGRIRSTLHIKKIAHRRNGTLRRIKSDWAQGDANFPHVALDADTLCYTAADGMRRLCPTGDPARYFEIGAPFLYTGGKWQKVNLGQATRTANKISWQTANADLNIIHGGHFVKLEIPLKNGWQPPTGRVAFPVGLNGLTRNGSNLLADGKAVMSMQAPNVYDAANPADVRDVGVTFPLVSGQRYALLTLPDLTGMSSPVIDPTFTDGYGGDVTTSCDTAIEAGANVNVNDGISASLLQMTNYFQPMFLFNISSIPAAATLSSATLTLYCNGGQSDNAYNVTIHRCLTQWYEGNKDRAALDAGVDGSTYNFRNNNGAVVWGTGAGTPGGLAGTDYVAAATATTAVGTRNASYNWDGLADVSAWFGGTTNRGFWMKGAAVGQYKSYVSSDNATTGYRPKLVVEYTLPGGGGIFASSIFHSAIHGRTLVR
jgi:hypothetical protein